MKTFELSNAPPLNELLDLAGQENLILRTPDGREFVLAEVDDFEREVALVRQQPELMAFLQERSRRDRTYSAEEVRQALGLDS